MAEQALSYNSSKANSLSWLTAILIGLTACFVLFGLLSKAVSTPVKLDNTQVRVSQISLFRVQQESDLNTLQRELPPLPEQVLQKLNTVTPVQTQQQQLTKDVPEINVTVPDISMDSSIKLASANNLLNMATIKLAVVDDPETTSQFPPQYPANALRARIEGSVTLEFMVNEVGRAQADSIKVVSATPKGIFDNTVIRAIKRWRFKPQISNGKAVSFKARKTLEFRLDS